MNLGDKNYWIKNSTYSNYNQKGSEYFNCKIIDFVKCDSNACIYKATIEGFNTFNNEDENNHIKVYVEWKLDEYRFYISNIHIKIL